MENLMLQYILKDKIKVYNKKSPRFNADLFSFYKGFTIEILYTNENKLAISFTNWYGDIKNILSPFDDLYTSIKETYPIIDNEIMNDVLLDLNKH